MPANLVYEDGSYVAASPVSLPTFSAPFADQGINIDYILTQEWVQNLEDFVPLALDTEHPDYADFKLASEGEKRDLGGGKVQWTRTYAKLPEEFSRPNGNITYNLIGFSGIFGPNITATGRARVSLAVPCQLVRKFFRTTNPSADIPFIAATTYWEGIATNYVDYIHDNIAPFGSATHPSRTEYNALIAADDWNIVVEASRVSVWQGNIYVRETVYIKAQ